MKTSKPRRRKIVGSNTPAAKLNRFITDFEPLEQELRTVCICPVERMIVELKLTPRKVKEIQRRTGYFCHWFAPAHAAMQRHGLLYPRVHSWEAWLARYKKRRKDVASILKTH